MMTASHFGLMPPPEAARARSRPPHPRACGHRRPWWRRLRRPVALVASITVSAAGLGACGAGRGALGTNAGRCFAALPVAKQAVGGRGSFAGVRRVDVARVTARSERAMHDLLDLLPVPPPHDICLVAYTGSFTPSQVERPVGPPPPGGVGRYAIVAVTTQKPELLATFVVRHAPLNFARVHVGF
jgi:hypothetical protein